jgi:hypothetical protein
MSNLLEKPLFLEPSKSVDISHLKLHGFYYFCNTLVSKDPPFRTFTVTKRRVLFALRIHVITRSISRKYHFPKYLDRDLETFWTSGNRVRKNDPFFQNIRWEPIRNYGGVQKPGQEIWRFLTENTIGPRGLFRCPMDTPPQVPTGLETPPVFLISLDRTRSNLIPDTLNVQKITKTPNSYFM